jgi:hypothetical protein
MKKLYILLFSCFAVCFLSACQKNESNKPVQTDLIIGKWHLQQQDTLIYANNVKQTDTSCVASPYQAGNLVFNKDGTFSSASYSFSNSGSLQSSNTASQDSTYGTYSIVNSDLNVNVSIAGFRHILGFYNAASTDVSTTPTQVVNLVSRTSKITMLTSSKLNLHFEMVFNTDINNKVANYTEQEDYYYTK